MTHQEPPSLTEVLDDLHRAHQQFAVEVAAAGLPAGHFLFIDWEPLSDNEALRRHVKVIDLSDAPPGALSPRPVTDRRQLALAALELLGVDATEDLIDLVSGTLS